MPFVAHERGSFHPIPVHPTRAVPGHSWQSWAPGTVALVNVKGSTQKKILAGTFKWQMYETGVTSFIASGNSPYFTCDNKGCDPTSGIALKYTNGTMGDFELSVTRKLQSVDTIVLRYAFFPLSCWMDPPPKDPSLHVPSFCSPLTVVVLLSFSTVALPAKAGSSNDFKLVMWGEDQDHIPYDFSATVNFAYSSTINAVHAKINALAAKQLQIHHDNDNGGDGPNAHCMEMTVTAPSTNKYWQAHGYQYPIQLWPKGPCDHKKYNFFNRKSDIATGVTMVTLGEHTDGSAMKLQDASTVNDVDCSDNKCLYLITNPSSPSGKQHCQELDNPEGTKGGYWASKGWKYTSPPWTQGKCDRNLFNFVNRETQDLDGFKDVTFWYLGIQH